VTNKYQLKGDYKGPLYKNNRRKTSLNNAAMQSVLFDIYKTVVADIKFNNVSSGQLYGSLGEKGNILVSSIALLIGSQGHNLIGPHGPLLFIIN
jgi:hypothetical protein